MLSARDVLNGFLFFFETMRLNEIDRFLRIQKVFVNLG